MGEAYVVLACEGLTCWQRLPPGELRLRARRAITAAGLSQVRVLRETCFGHCARGANLLVAPVDVTALDWRSVGLDTPGAVLYHGVDRGDALDRIVAEHLTRGQVASGVSCTSTASGTPKREGK